MSLKNEVDQLFQAGIESGNIRYHSLPAGEVACAVAAWAELFVAAASPVVPFWLVGFQIGFATGLVVEQSWRIDLGYGGADGAAIAADTVLLTDWPIHVSCNAAGILGTITNQILPFPIRIPVGIVDPGSRMAYTVVDNPIGGAAVGATSFRVLLATVVGD